MTADADKAEAFEVPGAEIDTLQRLYRQEVERVMRELEARLLRERADVRGVGYARDNLRVLKACYLSNTLSVQALDVLLQHLITLTRIFHREPG